MLKCPLHYTHAHANECTFHHSFLNIRRDHILYLAFTFALPYLQNCMNTERLFSVANFLPQARVTVPGLI